MPRQTLECVRQAAGLAQNFHKRFTFVHATMMPMKQVSSSPHKNKFSLKAVARALITPPPFSDPLDNVLSQTLHFILILAVIFSGGYSFFTGFVTANPSGSIVSGCMTVISLVLFWQLRKKKLQLVSHVLVYSAYIALMLTLFMNGGIRDEAGLVLIALVSIAGFVLGMQVLRPMGIATAVLLIIIFIAERLELIPEKEHLMPVAADELILALIAVSVTTVILYQITKVMNRSTDQIKAQAQFLWEKNVQLEETQKALILAKEEAEEANRSRSVFFSRMSHDLRTPLSNILGMATHLMNDKSQPQPEEQREFLQGIHHSGVHLLNLINNLLDISRLEAHELHLHPSPTSLFVTLSEIILMLRISAQEKGIDLRLEIDQAVPETVRVDEQRLQQILINLVGNAVKFTDKGEVALIATAVSTETAVAAIRFEVVDTGCGIASHELDKIFDPFVQVATVSSSPSGTGLGLAICRQLVEAMGGILQVESCLGKGSRFWFTLHLPQV